MLPRVITGAGFCVVDKDEISSERYAVVIRATTKPNRITNTLEVFFLGELGGKSLSPVAGADWGELFFLDAVFRKPAYILFWPYC